MKLQFFKQHKYGNKIIKANDIKEIPDKEAIYMIRMGLAQSVDEGTVEKVEVEHVKEKVEFFEHPKEKRERKPRKKK